jgi:hypothetical protein
LNQTLKRGSLTGFSIYLGFGWTAAVKKRAGVYTAANSWLWVDAGAVSAIFILPLLSSPDRSFNIGV